LYWLTNKVDRCVVVKLPNNNVPVRYIAIE
jgi:hypothetical protein